MTEILRIKAQLNVPRRRGNLWKYSTAKLEARGAMCKHILRRQTSAQPRKKPGVDGAGSAKSRCVIQKRGGSAQLLGLIALREQRTLKVPGR
eukprot:6053134-Pleurochrysis_carterae.AAC.1